MRSFAPGVSEVEDQIALDGARDRDVPTVGAGQLCDLRRGIPRDAETSVETRINKGRRLPRREALIPIEGGGYALIDGRPARGTGETCIRGCQSRRLFGSIE